MQEFVYEELNHVQNEFPGIKIRHKVTDILCGNEDIERILEMQQWPVFQKLKFGTLRVFFQKAEAVRKKLPVIDHELNAFFTGCYTTQSRIKLANRRAEFSR